MTRSSRRIRLVEWFNLESVGKSPARFDFAKLENLNGHYIRHMADAELLKHFIDFLPHAEGGKALLAQIDDAMMAKLLHAMPGLKERAKTLVELMKGAQFLFAVRPLKLDDKAGQIMADGGRDVLARPDSGTRSHDGLAGACHGIRGEGPCGDRMD